MDEVRAIFNEVVASKEKMLEEKAATFIPMAKDELADKLSRITKLVENKCLNSSFCTKNDKCKA
jgi:hypothetical protein